MGRNADTNCASSVLRSVLPVKVDCLKYGLLWDTNDLILAIWTSDYITYVMKTPVAPFTNMV